MYSFWVFEILAYGFEQEKVEVIDWFSALGQILPYRYTISICIPRYRN